MERTRGSKAPKRSRRKKKETRRIAKEGRRGINREKTTEVSRKDWHYKDNGKQKNQNHPKCLKCFMPMK
jgi:hypothetical protein